jgi:hypothetical protein
MQVATPKRVFLCKFETAADAELWVAKIRELQPRLP